MLFEFNASNCKRVRYDMDAVVRRWFRLSHADVVGQKSGLIRVRDFSLASVGARSVFGAYEFGPALGMTTRGRA
jgi:hypothetical protein